MDRSGRPTGTGREIERALVIADDPWFRRALRRAVVEVFSCNAEASSRLRWPQGKAFDLVVIDVDLLTEKSFRLVETIIAGKPRPLTVVVASSAPPRDAFRLGSLGVEAFLQKPFTLTQFKEELAGTRAQLPSLEFLGRSWTGRVDLKSAQGEVRKGMLDQALELSQGNLTRAARILAVSRQALQRTRSQKDEGDSLGGLCATDSTSDLEETLGDD